MRWSFKQCLAWLVLSITLISIKTSVSTDIITQSGGSDEERGIARPGPSRGPGPPREETIPPPVDRESTSRGKDPPPEENPPRVTFSSDRVKSKSALKGMFNYLFGLDYPYHQFTPPKEEEPIDFPEGAYSDVKDELDILDLTDMDDEKLNKLLHDVLLDYHPGHFTRYNAEWGHTVLTKDGQIPLGGDAIHFDIFDGYLPRGVKFNDLRVLFLYTIDTGYYLYKVKFGDMVVTLSPDLENVTVHLFESYGGLTIIRILFFVKGMFEKHEYIETGRKSRLFKKMSGRSITPPMPKFDPSKEVTEDMILTWMRERYRDIAKTNPNIVEELINYKIVFTR
ncbi:hypothetical protein TpMuguga_04g02515 [Theileria parva strain Muguga]|uniref:uncharacterized protein n=1 Tax=Theileria parva strain Muguga TaxID=333668 RepID=UPI001C61DCB7|nr:uncharacterized protein TpMuguga_04g02515 [Theileria parva strain Muguga]KAF5153238.1 hypothetical protein TpMuguga_04g02515 [Theileria parva strain Muguga]